MMTSGCDECLHIISDVLDDETCAEGVERTFRLETKSVMRLILKPLYGPPNTLYTLSQLYNALTHQLTIKINFCSRLKKACNFNNKELDCEGTKCLRN